MRSGLLLPALAILAFLCGGCAPTVPYRTSMSACRIDGARSEAAGRCDRAAVENYPARNFSVAYVELTDQGLFHRRDQMEKALELVGKPSDTPTHVVVFVHGWKHSARFGDRNVEAFTGAVMPALAASRPGRTVGIYVGWRGSPVRILPESSFYDRKNSADHIARGSLRELLSNLRVLSQQNSGKFTITLIGHSFGGLILFNAISGSIMDSLVTARHSPLDKALAPPIYDLAILLNPAFEATRFEPLFQAAKSGITATGGWRWPDDQRPIFISITSEADEATRTIFPLGRLVNTLFQHEGATDQDDPQAFYGNRVEKLANNATMGHLERYRTHRLDRAGSGIAAVECRALPNPLVRDTNHFPLWNMFAAQQVIPGHSDIYDAALWKFIAGLPLKAGSGESICRSDG